MWFIGVEIEQETSAPLFKKNSGSAPVLRETDLSCSNPELRNHLSSFGRRNSEDCLTRSSLTDRISFPECFQAAA